VWGHILDYAQRLPPTEMGVMLVSDTHRGIGYALFAVPRFSGWANAAADIILCELNKTTAVEPLMRRHLEPLCQPVLAHIQILRGQS
jgi:hypothetical protein